MSATNLTFGEIRLQLAKRFSGYDPEVITSFLNERYRDVCRLCDWTSLRIRAVFSTLAPYQDGTVAINPGSNAVAGTLTAWTAAMSGQRIRFGGDEFYYTFTWVSATSGTLDRPYEGTLTAPASYVIWFPIYTLPADVRELLEVTLQDPAGNIVPASEKTLSLDDPTRVRRSKPLKWAPYQSDVSTPELQQIELWPGPDKVYAVQIWYVQDPSQFEMSDTAVYLPKWFSPNVLYHGVEADVRRVLDDPPNLLAAQMAETKYSDNVNKLKTTEALKKGPSRLSQSAWQNRRLNAVRSEDYIDRYLSE